MHYLPELYYLQDQKDFPFRKAVRVTATAISHWSHYFYAEVIAPVSEHVNPTKCSGSLPDGKREREAFITELIDWLFENSIADDLFALFLSDSPTPNREGIAKFDHHDDTCCWVLNLTEQEFATLQAVWKENGLPEDLFYPAHAMRSVPLPGNSIASRLLRKLGMRKYYTPRQWEALQSGAEMGES